MANFPQSLLNLEKPNTTATATFKIIWENKVSYVGIFSTKHIERSPLDLAHDGIYEKYISM